MNENKKGLRGIHPDLKRLYQPIAKKAVSEATISTMPTLDKKILNTWQGYLLDTPGGKAPVANCQGFVVPLLAFASCRITRFSLSFTV